MGNGRASWLALVLLAPAPALAAHPLVTDDTGTQGQRKYQLELNGEIGRDRAVADGVESREHSAAAAAAFSWGVFDTVDLVVGIPWGFSSVREGGALASDGNGVGDMSLEVKWRFFEREGFSLAFKPGLTVPTGDESRGFGNGRVSYAATLIASQELGPVTLHLNASYTRNEFALQADREANRSDIWHASMAGSFEVLSGLQLVANAGVEANPDRAADTPPVFAVGGAIYSVTENLDLDLGVKVGLTEPEIDVTGLFGMAWRF
jgi:hypothetical protein